MKKKTNVLPQKIVMALVVVVMAALGLSACTEDDSDVVNHNLTKASKNFEVYRAVSVVNGITDKEILRVEGLCDISPKEGRIFITCKVAEGDGKDSYVRHQHYTSDNTFVLVEQLRGIKVSAYHYRYTFKPQTVIPDVDVRGDAEDLPENQ